LLFLYLLFATLLLLGSGRPLWLCC